MDEDLDNTFKKALRKLARISGNDESFYFDPETAAANKRNIAFDNKLYRKCVRGSYHLNLIRKPTPPTRYSSEGAVEMVPDSKTGGSHGGPPVYKFIMKPAGMKS